MSGISHSNVVGVYDFGTLPSGELYYVMEHVEGVPLCDLMEEGVPMDVHFLLRIARHIASGISAAHVQHVVHRDLKPENVIVCGSGNTAVAKVVDFGIAKLLDDQEKKLTRTGVVTGTPHYISPEQARAGEVDERSDVYSLGVMLYEMAVGQLPFSDEQSWVELLEAHVYEIPKAPSERGVDVGPLEPIIMRCLCKDPRERFQTMGALLRALAGIGSAPTLPPPPRRTNELPSMVPPSPAPRSYKLGLGLGMLGVTVLLVAAVWGVTRSRSEPTPPAAIRVPAAPVPVAAPAAAPEPAVTSEVEVATTQAVSVPEGAEVYVDEVLIGNTPVAIPRPEEGEQQVRFHLAGHIDRTRAITPESEAEWRIVLPAERRAAAPAAPAAPPPPEPVAEEPAPRAPQPENPRPELERLVNPWEG